MEPGPHDFESTCLPFLPDCYAFALSLTRRSHDAEDLVQDTFIRAHGAFHRFTPGTNAKAWLFTILRRLHIDRYRRARIRPTSLPEDELVEMAGATTKVTPDATENEMPWDDLSAEALAVALDDIPDPFQLAVRLRDLEGFTYREIGEVLGVPAGTVMSRLHRGREYLRKRLVSLVEEQAHRAADARGPGETP